MYYTNVCLGVHYCESSTDIEILDRLMLDAERGMENLLRYI